MMAPANHQLLKRDPAARSKSPSQSRIHSPRPGSASVGGSPRRAGSVSGDSYYRGLASPAGRPGTAPTPASTPAGGVGAAQGLSVNPNDFAAALARAQAGDNSELAALVQQLSAVVQQKGGEQAGATPARGGAEHAEVRHTSPAKSMAGGSVATGPGTMPALTQAQIKGTYGRCRRDQGTQACSMRWIALYHLITPIRPDSHLPSSPLPLQRSLSSTPTSAAAASCPTRRAWTPSCG